MPRWLRAVVFSSLAAGMSMPCPAQLTRRASVDSNGAESNGASGTRSVSLSADGRFVAFDSAASDLVPGDTNGKIDAFVHDRFTGITTRVSLGLGGVQANDRTWDVSISADGRYVAFSSYATNLLPEDTNGKEDIFVRDLETGSIESASVDTAGDLAFDDSFFPALSVDGRYVVFASKATNLVPGDTNGVSDVFLRDRVAGTTERVSVASSGAQGNALSWPGSLSADARFVVFTSLASNFVASDLADTNDVFVRDRLLGTTERVSEPPNGDWTNARFPTISADGRYVAFLGNSVFDPGDTNGCDDVFVRDRLNGTIEDVSVDSSEREANNTSDMAVLSTDGRYVAFVSAASNLAPDDPVMVWDVFVRDRAAGTTERVTMDVEGLEVDGHSTLPSISSDGRFVGFRSFAENLVPGDTNLVADVFVRDRNASGFTGLCSPGVDGVIGCPCSNTPSSTGRGCDNSSGTGGATLAALGFAYLSGDSLVFVTAGEKPTATSVVLQGTSLVGSGAVYGQGVRCAGGSLKRLFTKSASAGSITAPDFSAGDPTVSARSAAKGSPIAAGQSRWYLVFYRDPTVLGGCPSGSTFNATQTGRVSWSF
jgi:Tol biopolymer transport system component